MVSDDTRLRDAFLLDPDVTFLNHGSFGAVPREVFARYAEWQRELERQPVLFLARRIDGLLAEARAALGAYVNADPDDLVFVPNASSGVNVAAWPLGLGAGDEVLSTDLEYGALDFAWEHVCGDFGARYVRTPVRLPVESSDDLVETIWEGVGPRTKVLFLSHYTSGTALVLPVAELCRRARERGIVTIVDGAHVPGHIPLDVRGLDPDFYAGNCHKWLCAPKGAGFLYVRRELQRSVHPLMISWGYEDGDDASFVRRHEKQGTRDPAAYLTVPAAIDWQREHDWERVRERCRELARRARNELGLEPLTPDSKEFFRQMVALRLPAGVRSDLQERLYEDYGIEIPVTKRGDERFLRPSFQGYNDDADLERLRGALAELL